MYSDNNPYAGYTWPEQTQRERIAQAALKLKELAPQRHEALRHVVTNLLDDLDAVETVITAALENYVSARNDTDALADEQRPETAAALTVEEKALREVFRAMDAEIIKSTVLDD